MTTNWPIDLDDLYSKRHPLVEITYGPFIGGDPRNYLPDEECCTPDEWAAWAMACTEWDAGEGIDRGPGCSTFGDGSVVSGKGFGIGTGIMLLTPEEAAFMRGEA